MKWMFFLAAAIVMFIVGMFALIDRITNAPQSLAVFVAQDSTWQAFKIVIYLVLSAAFFECSFQLYERAL